MALNAYAAAPLTFVPSIARTNLDVNPQQSGSGAIVFSARWGLSGTRQSGISDGPLTTITNYLRLTVPSTPTSHNWYGADFYANADSAPGTTGKAVLVPVVAGQSYNFSAYLRSSAAIVDPAIGVRFHDGAGTYVSAFIAQGFAGVAANTWTRVNQTVIAPAGAKFVVFRIGEAATVTPAAGVTYDITGIMVEQATQINDYFDASFTDTLDTITGRGARYDWTGLAFGSSTTITVLRTPPDFRVNYVINPHLLGSTNVGSYWSPVRTSNSTGASDGGSYMHVVQGSASGAHSTGDGVTPSFSGNLSLDVGDVVTMSFDLRSDPGYVVCAALKVDAGAGGLSQTNITGDGSWHRYTLSYTATGHSGEANIGNAQFVMGATGGSAGSGYPGASAYFDLSRVIVEVNTSGSYFDGNTADDLLTGPGYSYAWLGATNNSASSQVPLVAVPNIGVELEVYRYSNPSTRVNVIPARMAPTSLDEIAGPGGGSFSVSTHDPKILADPTLLDYRNIIKCRVDGKIIGAWVVQKKSTALIDADAASEVIEVAGENLRTLFKDAIVYPEGGIKTGSFDNRAFNFASIARYPGYTADGWVAPVVVSNYGNQVNSFWRYNPANWPDAPNAKWVWGMSADGLNPTRANVAPGDNYFRYEFTVATEGDHSVFIAADDYWTLYMDGQQVAQSDFPATAYHDTYRFDTHLYPGSHVLGIKATNTTSTRVGGVNPAAVICALYRAGDATASPPTAATLLTTTGSAGWASLDYPTQAPGWSVGAILIALMGEAAARGVTSLGWLAYNFSSTTDSYGQPWDHSYEWSFDVGATYADVIDKLEELACDIWIDPDTLTLNAAPVRGKDRSVYGTSPVTPVIKFERGKNLLQAGIDGVSEITNSMMLKTTDGYTVQTQSASKTKYGAIESFLDTGIPNAPSIAISGELFTHHADAEEGATYQILPIPGYVPFKDFNVGDWVLAPNGQELGVKRRIMSLSVTEDGNTGFPVYTVEFDTIFQDEETRIQKYLQKQAGSIIGSSVVANTGSGTNAPAGQPVIFTPSNPASTIVPVAPANLAGTSTGVWSPDGVTTVATAVLTWDAVTLNQDGSATVPASYEIWGKKAADSSYIYLATAFTNTATLSPFTPADVWNFEVRAINSSGSMSDFSSAATVTMGAPTTPLDAPTTPTLTSKSSVLIVTWNGNLNQASPHAPQKQFRYVYAEVSPHSANTWTQSGMTLAEPGQILLSGLTVGSSYDVRLTAVDGANIESAKSAVATLTVAGVDVPDISTALAGSITTAQTTATNAAALAAARSTDFIQDPQFHSGADNVKTTTINGTDANASPLPNNAATFGVLTANDNWTRNTKITTIPGHTYQIDVDVKLATGGVTTTNFGLAFWYLSADGATSQPAGWSTSVGNYFYNNTDLVTPTAAAVWTHATFAVTVPSDGSIPFIRPALRGGGGGPWLVTNFHVTDITPAATANALATAAQTLANTANTNAGAAQTAATAAQTTANGKNKISYGTTAPTASTPGVPGDVYFVQTGSPAQITGQYVNTAGTGTTSGNTWLSQNVTDSLLVAGINAGKITVGTLSANVIGANSITVDKLVVTDQTNLATVSELDASTMFTGSYNGMTTYSTTTVIDSGYVKFTSASDRYAMLTYQHGPVAFEPGDTLRFSFTGHADSARTGTAKVWVYDSAGSNASTSGTPVTFSTTDQDFSFTVTAPTSMARASTVKYIVGLDFSTTDTTRAVWLKNIKVTRMTGASLVVNGSITTNALTVGNVGPNAVANGSFEDQLQGWQLFTGSTGSLAAATGVASAGLYAAQYTHDATTNSAGFIQDAAHQIPVSLGQATAWAFTANAKMSSGTGTVYAAVYFYTAANKTTPISGTYTWANAVSVGTSWATLTGTLPSASIPATAQYMAVAFFTTTASGVLYIDDVSAQKVIVSAQIADGAITATKVAANAITASKITITDFTNLWPDPYFQNVTDYSGLQGSPTTAPAVGSALLLNARDHHYGDYFPATPGDTFLVEFDANHTLKGSANSGQGLPMQVGLWQKVTTGNAYDGIGTQAVVPAVSGDNAWQHYTFQVSPQNQTSTDAQIYFQIAQTAGGSHTDEWMIANLNVRRMNAGDLVVDGSITGEKFSGDAFDGLVFTGNTFQTNVDPALGVKMFDGGIVAYDSNNDPTVWIQNDGTIYFAQAVIAGSALEDGTVTGVQIQDGAIQANHIEAGTITTDLISSDFESNLDLSSNTQINLIVNGDPNDPNVPPGLRETQERFLFDDTGATIQRTGSAYAVHIGTNPANSAEEGIQILLGGTPISTWNAGVMNVNQLKATIITIGNHQVQQYSTGTVVKWVSS